MFDKCVKEVLQVLLRFACCLICEWLEECNTLLECGAKRRGRWHVKDHARKSILMPIGSITFTRTRFIHKETKETVYHCIPQVKLHYLLPFRNCTPIKNVL